MPIFSKHSNAEASLINLFKYLKIGIDPEKIVGELEKHPEYPSMLAISDVLTTLNIENSAFRLDFNELSALPVPFMANLNSNGGEFVIVNDINATNVYYADERKATNKAAHSDFKKKFTGVVLTAVPASDFDKNKQDYIFSSDLKNLIIIAGFLLILGLILYNTGYYLTVSLGLIFILLIKITGLTTSVLLLIQSVDGDNPLIQLLCQGGGKTDCNAILSSKAAKVFNGLSWSEMGFFYFSGTWLLLLFGSGIPACLSTLAILNLVSLPYTIYSIYYQAMVAKKWCVLCCTVQAILWVEFIAILVNFNRFNFFVITNLLDSLSLTFICLLLPVLLWLVMKPILLKLQQLKPLKQQLRKFKYNSELFNQMLDAQPLYKQPDETWSIVLGNTDPTNIITMVTNPYCPPCSKMHKVLNELMEGNDDLQARIVFTAQNDERDIQTPVTRHLMALSTLADKSKLKNALHDWYEQKQKNYESWSKKHPVQLIEEDYYKLEEQRAWCEMAEVAVTPTMFINGHLLPSVYQLNDLKYMLQ